MLSRKLLGTHPEGPATLTYVTVLDLGTAGASFTFSDVDFGGAGLIVIAVQAEFSSGNRPVTSVTIGGNTATLVQNASKGTSNSAIATLEVTSNIATVVVNFAFTSSNARCRIGVWRINNYSSPVAVTSSNTSAVSGVGASITLNSLKDNDVVVCGYTIGTQNIRASWTNAISRYDSNIAAGSTGASGADTTVSADGNLTISTTHAGSTQPIVLVGAVWR